MLLLCAIIGAVVIPFFVISAYNNPSGDDFDWLQGIRQRGFIGQTEAYYNAWTGRYALTSFYLFLEPTVHNPNFLPYKLFPVFLIILLAIAVMLLLKSVFPKAGWCHTSLFGCLITAFYIATMPSPSQGLYWFSSSSNYFFASILAIFLFTILFFLSRVQKMPAKILFSVLAIILIIFSCGANEITLITVFCGYECFRPEGG